MTKKKLEELGHRVFVSGFIENYLNQTQKQIEENALKDKYENDAMREFIEKIKKSNAILVLNYDRKGIKNYIGGNTFLW